MREIKFRGKRKDNCEWVYGGINIFDEKIFIIVKARYIPDTRDWDTVEYYEKNPTYKQEFIEVIPETVGQYTLLKDKNGTKIYEGDIVEAHFDENFPDDATYLKIAWDEERARFLEVNNMCKIDEEFDMEREFCSEFYTVVGNIYDNPNLIK